MCEGTRCQHHLDAAVLELEKDYEHMGIRMCAPMGEACGLESTQVIDTRTGYLWDRNYASTHVQPMFKIKHDIGWAQPATWDGHFGPTLHNEEDVPVRQADECRPDGYQIWIYTYLTGNGLPVTDELLTYYHAEMARRREEAEREAEEHRQRMVEAARERAERQERSETVVRGMRADCVIVDEVARINSVAMAQTSAYMEALRVELQRENAAVRFFVNGSDS